MPAPPAATQALIDETLVPFLRGDTTAAELLGLDTADISSLVKVGVAAFGANDMARARRVFQAVAAAAPMLSLAHQYLGLIAERERDFDRAVEHLANAGALLERLPIREPAQEAALTDVMLQTARALFAAGRDDVARDCLTELRGRPALDATAARLVDALLQGKGV